ncbi:NitT/TauT family transport system permease protein [Trinickia symbiotica]|uniref:ABC transporter permease n=1 Tax=Trinickia symbiotica TaxID=863227 RepID=A0A2N7X176_9BURK|nr:ABC transporter permease [Trinickia symbiotica]PMS35489.1 ABC transporter permease [Trinickia symbiotica]PPK45521.1 NitT/TauT family transport system permease protein [Trinickia symbiotica]
MTRESSLQSTSSAGASVQTLPLPPVRAEYEVPLAPVASGNGDAPLPLAERVFSQTWLRKSVIALLLLAAWEIAAHVVANDLLLPTFSATLLAFVQGIVSGELLMRTAASMSVLLRGYLLGVALAFALTSLAASTRIGRDLLTMLTAMFNPLPSIALLPLALLWFGLGTGSLLFVLVHAVLWPLALNTYAGFQSVPATLRMTGRNYGLRGLRQVVLILVPAALPAIIAGLRVGWAFAWRTLIAAELVFGTSSGSGGLGWYIFQNRNELYTDRVFAGLAAVILIGLIVEHLVFDVFEQLTVRRWGIQH